MDSKILSALRASDEYVSGEELSEVLGVSRTAVWKHINALRDEGYEIDSVKNRGYKLVSEPDRLDGGLILDTPESNLVIKRIKIMKETDSTNEEAKRIVHSGDEGGIVIAAERQTAGKGRFCRKWESPPEDGCRLPSKSQKIPKQNAKIPTAQINSMQPGLEFLYFA